MAKGLATVGPGKVRTLPKMMRPEQSSREALTTEVESPVMALIEARFCSISSSVCWRTSVRVFRCACASSPM
ncbi:MAG: hypothetical protein IPO50_02215 [Sphingomonadales bacterium]|nr:hypothetical protein [Sphingomonadales bacterium]